jgi:hypothetical protein
LLVVQAGFQDRIARKARRLQVMSGIRLPLQSGWAAAAGSVSLQSWERTVMQRGPSGQGVSNLPAHLVGFLFIGIIGRAHF